MLATATVLSVVGLALMIYGSAATRRVVREALGSDDRAALSAARGTRIVPTWVSAVVLCGWACIVGAAIAAIVAVLSAIGL